MAQVINIGTLVSTTIRPYYSDDIFPTVLSNDALGGIHLIQSKSIGIGFDEIIPSRRQWGMLVFVYDERKYYQLVPRNTGTPDVSKNMNWVEFTGGSVGSLEWVDSVKGIYGDNGLIPSPVTGDRFLVGSITANQFNGYKNQIAVFANYLNNFGGGYIFTEPTNGCTLRIDNESGVIYTFVGTSSLTGNWYKERQNTVRYIYPTSNNGLTFSYTTTDQTPLTGYTYSVFYANFGTSNAGTVSLSIDGNFYAPIKKVSSNALTDLSSGDFGSGVEYQLTYDNGVFQIFLSSASQGGTIGPAEPSDGTYTDGLFTDFTPSTPIGTPIDRFNEILKALVPPPAPDLNSWSVTNTSQFVSGKVSYTDAQAASPLGYVNTDSSPNGDVNQGGLYAVSGYRLGVTSKNTGTTTITGVLNSNVPANPSLPTAAYTVSAFGNGITGSIVLYLNSSTISSVDLASTYGSIITTGGVDGGLSLSAATASKFSNGNPFEFFWYRTGTYVVKKSSGFMNNGFNQITVKHILPSTTITLTSYEFLADDSVTPTSYGSPNFTSNFTPTSLNTKYLSGIRYYTSGSFLYSVLVDNAYKNTYYPDTDAVIFSDVSSGGTSSIYNGQSYTTNTSSNQVFTPGLQQPLGIPSSVNMPFNASTSFTLTNNTNFRKINGTSVVNVSVKRTVQGNTSGGARTITGWYIDTYAATSTTLLESFNDENNRLQNLDFDTVSAISGGAWVSSSSLLNVYRNALQVADGRLLYPFADFSTGVIGTNPNSGIASTVYTFCNSSVLNPIHGNGNNRTYTRVFNLGSTSYAKFSLVVNHFGTTFVPVGTSLNNNSNCYLEFKLPYNETNLPTGGLIDGSVTGWLDASKDFSGQVTLSDGAGCRGQSQNPISGATWSINFGQRETGNSSGRVLMRITAGPSWTGYIETVTLSVP